MEEYISFKRTKRIVDLETNIGEKMQKYTLYKIRVSPLTFWGFVLIQGETTLLIINYC